MDRVDLMMLQSIALNLSISKDHLKLESIEAADDRISAALLKINKIVDRQEKKASEALDLIEDFIIQEQ